MIIVSQRTLRDYACDIYTATSRIKKYNNDKTGANFAHLVICFPPRVRVSQSTVPVDNASQHYRHYVTALARLRYGVLLSSAFQYTSIHRGGPRYRQYSCVIFLISFSLQS